MSISFISYMPSRLNLVPANRRRGMSAFSGLRTNWDVKGINVLWEGAYMNAFPSDTRVTLGPGEDTIDAVAG